MTRNLAQHRHSPRHYCRLWTAWDGCNWRVGGRCGRGLRRPNYLDQFSDAERAEGWHDLLAEQPDQFVYVAVTPTGEVVGYACCDPDGNDDPAYPAELTTMHVLPAYRNGGHWPALSGRSRSPLAGAGGRRADAVDAGSQHRGAPLLRTPGRSATRQPYNPVERRRNCDCARGLLWLGGPERIGAHDSLERLTHYVLRITRKYKLCESY